MTIKCFDSATGSEYSIEVFLSIVDHEANVRNIKKDPDIVKFALRHFANQNDIALMTEVAIGGHQPRSNWENFKALAKMHFGGPTALVDKIKLVNSLTRARGEDFHHFLIRINHAIEVMSKKELTTALFLKEIASWKPERIRLHRRYWCHIEETMKKDSHSLDSVAEFLNKVQPHDYASDPQLGSSGKSVASVRQCGQESVHYIITGESEGEGLTQNGEGHYRLGPGQVKILEAEFRTNQYPGMQQMADRCGATETQVKAWFKEARRRYDSRSRGMDSPIHKKQRQRQGQEIPQGGRGPSVGMANFKAPAISPHLPKKFPTISPQPLMEDPNGSSGIQVTSGVNPDAAKRNTDGIKRSGPQEVKKLRQDKRNNNYNPKVVLYDIAKPGRNRITNAIASGNKCRVVVVSRSKRDKDSPVLNEHTRVGFYFTKEQMAILEEEFLMDNSLKSSRWSSLAAKLQAPEVKVKQWFYGRRHKQKKLLKVQSDKLLVPKEEPTLMDLSG